MKKTRAKGSASRPKRRAPRPGASESRAAAREPQRPTPRAERPTHPPIVGIGASAGGLDAFVRFFGAVPAASGTAFVLIQHLDPTHESLTAELVGRHTPMPVTQVEGDTQVMPDHVYVIPPNKNLSIVGGALRLTPPTEPRGMRTPVDFFLRSLAEDQGDRAIGIILSGTGTDGTLGLKEIKGAGGLAMVQDPASAQRANDYVVDVEHPRLGKIAVLGSPVHFGGTTARVRSTAPELGQHTDEVLAGILGYLAARISDLRQRKII
jgi:chemotaxis response regulator CheB